MADPIFWQKFYDLGKAAGAKFPELVAAQAALESGWGKHVSGKNNYFGFKGSPGTVVKTREVIGGKEIFIRDEFKDFDSPLECVEHLVSRWYEDYKGYQGVNRASTAQEAAMLLQSEGYATDPVYSELLINLMEDNHIEEEVDECFLPNAAKYYAEEPHQVEAWLMLEENLDPEVLEAFKAAYRRSPIVPEKPAAKFPLDVPYYNQNDSATQHGHRMCFSSAMAMALEYIDSNKMDGDDDWYLNEVFKFGDTVSSTAQVAAARSLGYEAEFRTDGSLDDLERLLDDGIPVPVGILHKGSADHPTGGGHWITLIGYDDTHFWVNDPAGDLDLVNGGYHTWDSGKGLRYSKKNFMKRWSLDGDSDGWYVSIG